MRVRVQPRTGEELVIEPITLTDDSSEFVPCVLAPDDDDGHVVLSIADFERAVRDASSEHQPLIVFDQFEEILTLFDDDEGVELRRELAQMIDRLLREALPVKLLFAFREDYLGRVKQLLSARPELVDQALRLGPPSAASLQTIIRGPFERFPEQFERELDERLARRLSALLEQRFGTEEVSLSEVQTVCLRLWQSDDPDALLADKGVQGLLEDALGEALATFSPDLRIAAIVLLSQMVTSAGTRNVISTEDLVARVRDESPEVRRKVLDEALARLETDARLVRRERRRDIYLYEITSEFLVPWISQRREESRLAQERRVEEQRREALRKRMAVLTAVAGGLVILAAGVTILALWALSQRTAAERNASAAKQQSLIAKRNERAAAVSAREARAQTTKARSSAMEARRQRKVAQGQRRNAVHNKQEADAQRRVAEISADEAQRQAGVAKRQTARARSQETVATRERGEARRQAAGATSLALTASSAAQSLKARPDVSLALAYAAYRVSPRPEASEAVISALIAARRSGLRSVLSGANASAVAFTPGGALATAGERAGLARWNPTSHARRAFLRPRDGELFAFSPDGRSVVAATTGTIRVLATAGGKRLSRIRVGGGRDTVMRAVAWSPASKTVALATDDHIDLWSTRSRTRLARLRADPDDVFVTGGGGREVVSRAVTALAFSPDGRTLASGSEDGTVSIWDVRSRARRARLGRSEGGVATGSEGVTVARAANAVAALAFDADGALLAVANGLGTDLWKHSTRERLARLGHQDVRAVAFSPNGRMLATGDGPGIRLWNATTHRPIARLTTADDDAPSIESIDAIAFSPDGALLASAGSFSVQLWSTVVHKRQLSRGGNVLGLGLDPAGASLAVFSGDAPGVALWNPRSYERRASLDAGGVAGLAFSPDGKELAVAGEQGTVVWRPATRTPIKRLSTTGSGPLAFSPDGRLLASASRARITLWDPASWRRRGEIVARGREVEVGAVAFSPDSALLASVGSGVELGTAPPAPGSPGSAEIPAARSCSAGAGCSRTRKATPS